MLLNRQRSGYVQKALAFLRRLTTSPAGIFVAGQGYLQTPGNLALQSQTLGTAPWTSGGTGGTTFSGGKVLDTVTLGLHSRNQIITCPSVPYTAAFKVKAAEYSKVIINMTDLSTGDASWTFDLSAGTSVSGGQGSIGSWTAVSGSMALMPDGYYWLAVAGTRGAGTSLSPVIYLHNGTSATFAGTGTSGVFVSDAGLAQGTYTAQQIAAMGGIPLTTSAAVAPVYTDAHVYQGGANGVAVNSLLTGDYTLSDGSTGFSAVDGSAGLVLDGMGSVGAELAANLGPFANTTGWSAINATLAASGGNIVATATVTGANAVQIYFDVATVIGSTYTVAELLQATSATSITQLSVRVTDTAFTPIAQDTLSALPETGGPIFVATATTTRIIGRVDATFASGVSTVTIASASVKQVTGIHASQATAGNRPSVRRGIFNRQNYSNDLTNAGYTATNVSKPAGSITRTSAVAGCFLNTPAFTTPFAVGEKITSFALVKAKSLGNRFGLRPTGTYPDRLDAVFDLASGTVIGSASGGAFTGASASIAGPDANGYYMCAVSGTVGGTSCISQVMGPTDSSLSVAGWEGTSAILSDVFVSALGITLGTLTAQQILDSGGIPLTTSAAASNPAAGRYSWQFDGASKYLTLGSVPFQQSDDHAVIVALRRDSLTGFIDAFSIGGATATPLIATIECDNASSVLHAYWRDDASTLVDLASTLALGEAAVFGLRKVGNVRVLRKNGVQAATNTTALGATTVTAGYIGARLIPAPQGWFGIISKIEPLKGTFTDSDMLTLEREAASTLPNAPQF